MKVQEMKVFDVVALTQDHPEAGLQRGQVGTIVETLATAIYEVEFADIDGRPYAMVALPEDHLMILHHRPNKSAA
jgi:hypothetical protein